MAKTKATKVNLSTKAAEVLATIREEQPKAWYFFRKKYGSKQKYEKFEDEYRASHPEEFEEKPDPGIQAILKKLNVISQNIVTGDSNQKIRHENADNALDAIRDELQDYYRGIVRTIEALRERMF